MIREALGALGIARLGSPGFEADDVIGTLTHRHRGVMPVDVVTGDRDLLQLVHLQAGLLARAKLRPLAVRTRLHGQLQDLLEARMKAGLIRRYDPAILARLISGFVEYTAEACLVWGDGDVAPFEKTLIDLLRNALLPAPRRPGQRLVATLRARHTHPSKP